MFELRGSDSLGLSWVGEVLVGVVGMVGKFGGGVFDRFMKELFTKSFFDHIRFPDIAAVATESRKPGGGVVARRLKEMVDKGGTMEHCSDLDDVPLDDIIDKGPKWMFSKFLGLKMGEKMIKERNNSKEFMTLIFRYATSQSELSGPFYKVTSK